MTQADDKQTVQRGLFITFEGVEGCGKSTQTELVAKWCRERGRDCVVTREPGGTPLGEHVRDVVLDAGLAVEPPAELFLYLAARAQHVLTVIRPAIDSGRWIICDRFADSSVAYQGYGRGLGAGFVSDLNLIATGGLVPDITFVLDTDVQAGLDRARSVSGHASGTAGDRIESASVEFHREVQRGFREIAANEPDRVKMVGPGTIEDVFATVVSCLERYIKERGR